jgi:glycerol-3-phosphate acyltransferase PlsY
MNDMLMWAALYVVALASGSIPFGLIIASRRGVNIREHGSGNIGATNVGRVLGRRAGFLCFSLDLAKGLAPTLAAGWAAGLIADRAIDAASAALWFGVAASAVLGHMFTPWAGFRGGKGVATGLGALLGVFPWLTGPVLLAALVWLAMVGVWRYVGIASCVAACTIPLSLLAWVRLLPGAEPAGTWPLLVGSGALALVVVIKHRGNIRRTLAGVEHKVGAPKPPAKPAK